ncbi:MAG: 3-oxoacyl-[acyl-carrier-protein] synthase III C-terminal domain-containing protein [Legionella sp.]|nr:3-oxoacyl-[acyl-carrier-protein] synthase III C-terminal domain-containing protein [Legionella sp.]
MDVLQPNIRFDIKASAHTLPDSPAITNIEILQNFPRTADKSAAFQAKFAEKIHEEFGFLTRYWCHKPWKSLDDVRHLSSESLSLDCVKKIFSTMDAKQLQAFVLGSTTNKRYTGSQASAVLGHFGLSATAYDFKAGCSTSLASLHFAYALMLLGYNRVLVSCAETLSKVIDPMNEKTWIGVADGAAALWLEKNETGPFTIEKSFFCTDGAYVDAYTTKGLLPPTQQQLDNEGYWLQGDETLLKELALSRYTQMINALLPTPKERAEISWIIPHQVNRQVIDYIVQQNQLTHSEVLWDADKIGNIGGASILYTLARAVDENIFNRKGKILMMSVGGGLSYAAQVISFEG